MLDSIRITSKSHFGVKMPYFTERYIMNDISYVLICKPLLVYRFYCVAIFHSQTPHHVIIRGICTYGISAQISFIGPHIFSRLSYNKNILQQKQLNIIQY